MRPFNYVLMFFLMNGSQADAQEKATLSGFVRDISNKESLPFVNVYIKDLKIGTATNIEGYYAIPNIPEGTYTVQYSMLGYRSKTVTIDTRQEKKIVLDVDLIDQALQISEVIVDAQQEEEKRTTQTGRIVMQARDVAALPTIGEADVFRALQLMPGVKATSEISSGLNVRGGSTDQNLILLDGTVVYNPSHLFGFFSTFNNDAIKDIDLMKGGFPAEYGGRLSSVLNVTNIDGDRVTTHGKASISLLSTRLTGEGPVGHGSWFLSGRRTYFDRFVSLAGLDKGETPFPLYYFYDANGKLNQDLTENDKVSFVGYLGRDNLDWRIGTNELAITMGWGNQTGALKWTHIFDQTLYSNFTASYSHYLSETKFNFGGLGFGQNNSITDVSLRGDVDFFWTNDHLLKLGIWWSQYRVTYTEEGDGKPYVFFERPAQFSAYAQDEWTVSERWILQGGLRFEYQDLSKETGFGPRFNARYNLDDLNSLKFATGVYYQFLMAVPAGSDNGFSPFDVWIPINEKMHMSESYDFVLGYETRQFDGLTMSLESYYKVFRNLLSFKREFTHTTDVSELFIVGDGRAYGAEVFIQKKVGNITGTIGYTLSWTFRQFPELNSGKEFQPKYDRRHDLTLSANYQLADTWKLSAVFTYATGQAYTQGVAVYQDAIMDVTHLHTLAGPLYNRRLSPYNRFDVSITKQTTFFGLDGSWYFQVYNVYSRRNVWFKQFNTAKNPVEVTDVKLLPIIPTFGLDVSF